MDIRGFGAFDLYNDLGICGCGLPGEAYERVYEMLVRARNRENLMVIANDSLACGLEYFMAYTLDDRGFIDHGFNIDNSWITPKGKAMIEFIELIRPHDYEYAEDADENPVFWR